MGGADFCKFFQHNDSFKQFIIWHTVELRICNTNYQLKDQGEKNTQNKKNQQRN